MAEQAADIRIDLDAPLSQLQRALQRTIEYVAFGLVTARDATPAALTLPDVLPAIAPTHNEAR